MTGPVAHFGGRDVKAEAAQQDDGPSGWDWFKAQFAPALAPDPFRPEDAVLVELARYAQTEQGRAGIGWLHSITDGAPYPAGFSSLEAAALAAAKHEGRAGVGLVLTRAVAEGQRLRDAHNKG